MTVVMCTESLMWYVLTTNLTKCSQRVSDNVRRRATSVRRRVTSLARKCGQKEEETKNSNTPSIDTYPGSSAGLQANMELLGNLDRSACGASCPIPDRNEMLRSFDSLAVPSRSNFEGCLPSPHPPKFCCRLHDLPPRPALDKGHSDDLSPRPALEKDESDPVLTPLLENKCIPDQHSCACGDKL
eukprot:g33691.t1